MKKVTSRTSAKDTNDPLTIDLFSGLLSDSDENSEPVAEKLAKGQKKIAASKADVTASKPKRVEVDAEIEAEIAVEGVNDGDDIDDAYEPEGLAASVSPAKVARLTKSEPKSSRRRGPEKDEGAFRTISEVATEIGVQQHVLRFWESKFKQIKPLKRGGGRRYYRPDDVEMIKGIHNFLYNQGYTIKGVQRLLKMYKTLPTEGGVDKLAEIQTRKEPIKSDVSEAEFKAEVVDVLNDLKAMRAMLNGVSSSGKS